MNENPVSNLFFIELDKKLLMSHRLLNQPPLAPSSQGDLASDTLLKTSSFLKLLQGIAIYQQDFFIVPKRWYQFNHQQKINHFFNHFNLTFQHIDNAWQQIAQSKPKLEYQLTELSFHKNQIIKIYNALELDYQNLKNHIHRMSISSSNHEYHAIITAPSLGAMTQPFCHEKLIIVQENLLLLQQAIQTIDILSNNIKKITLHFPQFQQTLFFCYQIIFLLSRYYQYNKLPNEFVQKYQHLRNLSMTQQPISIGKQSELLEYMKELSKITQNYLHQLSNFVA